MPAPARLAAPSHRANSWPHFACVGLAAAAGLGWLVVLGRQNLRSAPRNSGPATASALLLARTPLFVAATPLPLNACSEARLSCLRPTLGAPLPRHRSDPAPDAP